MVGHAGELGNWWFPRVSLGRRGISLTTYHLLGLPAVPPSEVPPSTLQTWSWAPALTDWCRNWPGEPLGDSKITNVRSFLWERQGSHGACFGTVLARRSKRALLDLLLRLDSVGKGTWSCEVLIWCHCPGWQSPAGETTVTSCGPRQVG
jgi:hypothetical protein